MKQNVNEYQMLEELGEKVKRLIDEDQNECKELVIQALVEYPHAPQPQNLLGIIAEKSHDLSLAMKHYRAAWALAPNYRPSRENIDRLVSMTATHCCYYDEKDCDEKPMMQKTFVRKRLGA